jgi:hypothetical protein
MAELAQLEQHPLPSGRPRIEAPRSGHDDYAIALMALCHALVGGSRIIGDFVTAAKDEEDWTHD